MATQDREDALTQRVRRITDLAQEPLEFLSVITGYEILPIVSIDEAVKPLVSILPMVESQTYIAKMNCQDPTNGLTQDEAASIMLYTMEWEPSSLYTVLNATLRMKDRSKLKPWFLYMKLFFVALDRLPAASGRPLFRGVKLDLSNQYKLGKTIVWWGFSSCTVSMGVLESEQFLGRTGQRTMFNIECHSGKEIRQHSYLRDEDEVLVLPATQFEVAGCLQLTSDLHMIHLKEVQPPVPLRAPLLTSSRDVITLSAQNSPPTEQATTFIWLTKAPTTGSKLVQESATSSFTTILCGNPRLAEIIQCVQTDSTITQLDLSTNRIDDEGIKYLADALRNNQTITKLNLHRNKIRAEGAKHLADVLRNNQTITQLDLSVNVIGAEGAKYLADALQHNQTITQLNIRENAIGAEGAKHLADVLRKNQTITQLDLGVNAIGAEGAKHVADILRNNQTITQLSLYHNAIDDDGAKYLADALRNNQTIAQLALSSNRIDDQGAKYFADAFRNNQTLSRLYLSENEIGYEGEKWLNDVSKIRNVSSRCEIYLAPQNPRQENPKQGLLQRARKFFGTT